jgi:hypothetical protein
LWKQGFFEFKKQASELWVVWYKKVITQDDDNVCEICKENEKVWRIPLNVKFPSWHLYYPFCSDCRCSDDYSLVNPETGLLYD